MGKKIYITENRLKTLLSEYVSSKCYHFCDKDILIKILNSNMFVLRTNIVSKSEHWYQPKRRFFMSVTRNGHPLEGYSSMMQSGTYARIELDGDALNMNYRGHPVNYFSRGNEGLIYGAPAEREMYQSQKANIKLAYKIGSNDTVENEDRIFSSRPYIPNAMRYIKRIDIVVMGSPFGNYAYDIMSSVDPKWYHLMHFYDCSTALLKGKEREVVFPTQHEHQIYTRERVRDNDFIKRNGSISKPITCALLECGILKAAIGILRNEDAVSPKEFTYSIAKRYNLPIIEQGASAENDYYLDVNVDNEYAHCESIYQKLLEGDWHLVHDKILESILKLESGIKSLNTEFAYNKAALTAVRAITDELRKIGVETLSQSVQGRDTKGKEITPLKDQLYNRIIWQ